MIRQQIHDRGQSREHPLRQSARNMNSRTSSTGVGAMPVSEAEVEPMHIPTVAVTIQKSTNYLKSAPTIGS